MILLDTRDLIPVRGSDEGTIRIAGGNPEGLRIRNEAVSLGMPRILATKEDAVLRSTLWVKGTKEDREHILDVYETMKAIDSREESDTERDDELVRRPRGRPSSAGPSTYK